MPSSSPPLYLPMPRRATPMTHPLHMPIAVLRILFRPGRRRGRFLKVDSD